jgi:shikimate kinase
MNKTDRGFNTGNLVDLRGLSEEDIQKALIDFSEGNKHLYNLLVYCHNNGIRTISSEGDAKRNNFVVMEIVEEKEAELLQVANQLYFKGVTIVFDTYAPENALRLTIYTEGKDQIFDEFIKLIEDKEHSYEGDKEVIAKEIKDVVAYVRADSRSPYEQEHGSVILNKKAVIKVGFRRSEKQAAISFEKPYKVTSPWLKQRIVKIKEDTDTYREIEGSKKKQIKIDTKKGEELERQETQALVKYQKENIWTKTKREILNFYKSITRKNKTTNNGIESFDRPNKSSTEEEKDNFSLSLQVDTNYNEEQVTLESQKEQKYNSLEDSIILIGPSGAGKSTIAEELAKQLKLPRLCLDRVANHYKDTGRMAEFTSSDDFNLFLIQEGIKQAQEVNKQGIVDFGAGHSIFENREAFDKVKNLLKTFKNIVLLLPTDNIEESLNIINARSTGNTNDNLHFLQSYCNKELATMVIYTKNKTPFEISEEIIETIKMRESNLDTKEQELEI